MVKPFFPTLISILALPLESILSPFIVLSRSFGISEIKTEATLDRDGLANEMEGRSCGPIGGAKMVPVLSMKHC